MNRPSSTNALGNISAMLANKSRSPMARERAHTAAIGNAATGRIYSFGRW